MIFEVTHIWMERLHEVVVPMIAQQMRGRLLWLNRVRVK